MKKFAFDKLFTNPLSPKDNRLTHQNTPTKHKGRLSWEFYLNLTNWIYLFLANPFPLQAQKCSARVLS